MYRVTYRTGGTILEVYYTREDAEKKAEEIRRAGYLAIAW